MGLQPAVFKCLRVFGQGLFIQSSLCPNGHQHKHPAKRLLQPLIFALFITTSLLAKSDAPVWTPEALQQNLNNASYTDTLISALSKSFLELSQPLVLMALYSVCFGGFNHFLPTSLSILGAEMVARGTDFVLDYGVSENSGDLMVRSTLSNMDLLFPPYTVLKSFSTFVSTAYALKNPAIEWFSSFYQEEKTVLKVHFSHHPLDSLLNIFWVPLPAAKELDPSLPRSGYFLFSPTSETTLCPWYSTQAWSPLEQTLFRIACSMSIQQQQTAHLYPVKNNGMFIRLFQQDQPGKLYHISEPSSDAETLPWFTDWMALSSLHEAQDSIEMTSPVNQYFLVILEQLLTRPFSPMETKLSFIDEMHSAAEITTSVQANHSKHSYSSGPLSITSSGESGFLVAYCPPEHNCRLYFETSLNFEVIRENYPALPAKLLHQPATSLEQLIYGFFYLMAMQSIGSQIQKQFADLAFKTKPVSSDPDIEGTTCASGGKTQATKISPSSSEDTGASATRSQRTQRKRKPPLRYRGDSDDDMTPRRPKPRNSSPSHSSGVDNPELLTLKKLKKNPETTIATKQEKYQHSETRKSPQSGQSDANHARIQETSPARPAQVDKAFESGTPVYPGNRWDVEFSDDALLTDKPAQPYFSDFHPASDDLTSAPCRSSISKSGDKMAAAIPDHTSRSLDAAMRHDHTYASTNLVPPGFNSINSADDNPALVSSGSSISENGDEMATAISDHPPSSLDATVRHDHTYALTNSLGGRRVVCRPNQMVISVDENNRITSCISWSLVSVTINSETNLQQPSQMPSPLVLLPPPEPVQSTMRWHQAAGCRSVPCPVIGCSYGSEHYAVSSKDSLWDHINRKHTKHTFVGGKAITLYQIGQQILVSQGQLVCRVPGCGEKAATGWAQLGRHLKGSHFEILDSQPFNSLWKDKLSMILGKLGIERDPSLSDQQLYQQYLYKDSTPLTELTPTCLAKQYQIRHGNGVTCTLLHNLPHKIPQSTTGLGRHYMKKHQGDTYTCPMANCKIPNNQFTYFRSFICHIFWHRPEPPNDIDGWISEEDLINAIQHKY